MAVRVLTSPEFLPPVPDIGRNYGSSGANFRASTTTQLNITGFIRQKFGASALNKYLMQNVACSPLAMQLSLLTLTVNSRSQTLTELQNVVGLNNPNDISLYRSRTMGGLTTEMPGIELTVWNKLMIPLTTAQKQNLPEIAQLDFTHPVAALHVNEKIEAETKGKFKTVLEESDIVPTTSLVVVSAVYFKGNWAQSFTYIGLQRFQTDHGPVKYPMIQGQVSVFHTPNYNEFDAEIVQIPLAGAGIYSMIIILPRTLEGLPRVFYHMKLNPHNLNLALNQATQMSMNVTLPRLTIETCLDVKEDLQSMQLFRVFSNRFSEIDGLTHERLHIDVIKQVTHIEILDDGLAAPNPVPNEKQTTFAATRPFYFIINFYQEQLITGIFVGNFGGLFPKLPT